MRVDYVDRVSAMSDVSVLGVVSVVSSVSEVGYVCGKFFLFNDDSSYLMMTLEHIDFHIIGYWVTSLLSL